MESPVRDEKESPSRPPRTHSRSSRLSISSERDAHPSPIFHTRTRPSRSYSPTRSKKKSRHKSVRERFMEEENMSFDGINLSNKQLNNRKSSAETAIHFPITDEKVPQEKRHCKSENKFEGRTELKSTSLILLLALYILVGGLVFKVISILSCPGNIDFYKSSIVFNDTQMRQDENLMMSLWNLTLSLNVLHEPSWRSIAQKKIQKHRINCAENLIKFEIEKPDLSILPISTSILYSYSLVSMLGYPDECLNASVGRTLSWQLFTFTYTLIGVPLFILTLIASTNILKYFINTIISLASSKILTYVLLTFYYPFTGYVIFSLTGSRKPFLDLFNSLIFVGPLNCTHYPKAGETVSTPTGIVTIIKVIYLFVG